MESGDIGLLTAFPSTSADMLLVRTANACWRNLQRERAKNQPFKRWRPEWGLTTEKYEKEVVYWKKLLKEVGLK
jgi:hypothetical protein